MTDEELFPLGRIVMTQGIQSLIELTGFNPVEYVDRHSTGDWGDLSPNDTKENEFSLKKRLRLFSAYKTVHGKVWVITEADRSVTTILLPEEY